MFRFSTIRTLAVVALGLSVLAPAFGDPVADAKKEIQARYDKVKAGGDRKNIKVMMEHYAPDFTLTGQGRNYTLGHMRVQFGYLTRTMTTIKIVTTIQKVDLKGAVATVSAKEHCELGYVNQGIKKVEPMTVDNTLQDVWVKQPAGWLLKSTKVLTAKRVLNGKPAPALIGAPK